MIKKVVCYFFVFLFFAATTNAASIVEGAQRFKLKNGLTVILKEDHSWPVASVQVWVRAGSANETEKEAGISHLIEHMMFKGTKKREIGEIAKCIEKVGGDINAYTSFDHTVYYVNIPSKHIDIALDVLLDAVQHSIFDPEELKKEKEVVLEEYRRYQDMPDRILLRETMSLCYKVHPYRRPIIGYEKTIKAFNRKDILNYINKWYGPENISIVVVGDFDSIDVLEKIKELTKDFPERSSTSLLRPKEPRQKTLRKKIIYGNVHQLHLNMFWHIPSIRHKDTPILDLISYILSNGRSSRLYVKLKMKQNLVRSISSGIYLLRDPGIFYVNALLRPEDLQRTLDIIFQEIECISSKPISDKELKRAKRQAVADFIYAMEDISGQAKILGLFETLAGDFHIAKKYLDRIKLTTTQDIMEVAKRYLRPENLSIGILAPKGSQVKLNIPKSRPTKVILKNGIRLIIKENHKLPIVSFTAAFLGGTRLEKEGKWGISNFAARLLARGTKKRDAMEIASLIDSCAGILEGFSGRNSIGLKGKFLKQDIYLGLDLMIDILLNASFPESEVEKVRKDIISDIISKKDYPLPQAFELFYKTLYKHHPYGHPLMGTIETIRSIKRQDIIDWFHNVARPQDLVITVVGDINKNEIISYLRKKLEGWKKERRSYPNILPEPPLSSPRKVYKKRKGKQVHIILGFLGVSMKSKENISMDIVETALSSQSGRLFYELRDKKALAYVVTAFRRPGLETGAFGIYMACAPEKRDSAINAILDELKKLKKEGLTEAEIRDAKEYLLGSFIMGLQTNDSQAMQMTLNELYGLGYDYIHKLPYMIKEVKTEQIKEAISKVIVLNRYVLIVLGPESMN